MVFAFLVLKNLKFEKKKSKGYFIIKLCTFTLHQKFSLKCPKRSSKERYHKRPQRRGGGAQNCWVPPLSGVKVGMYCRAVHVMSEDHLQPPPDLVLITIDCPLPKKYEPSHNRDVFGTFPKVKNYRTTKKSSATFTPPTVIFSSDTIFFLHTHFFTSPQKFLAGAKLAALYVGWSHEPALAPNTKLSITRSFFELQSPYFA